MKIRKFNEELEDDTMWCHTYLKYFAEIKEIYPEFKYNMSAKSGDLYTVDFYTRHNHRFNFDKFLEIQSVINSKLQEIFKIHEISKYELSVENYERATNDESFHITGRVIIKRK